MNEIEAPRADPAPRDTPPAPEAPVTFGRKLAAERERQGLSVDEIASRLRLHPRQVQAIENEALPALPAPFLRGFVRNYAKELRLDPEPLVAELAARLGPGREQVTRIEAASAASARLPTAEIGSRRVVVGGALAALIALAVLGWMATRGDRRAEAPAQAPAKPAEAAAPSSSPAATPSNSDAPKEGVAPAPDNAPSSAPATPSSSAPGPGSAAPVVPATVNVVATPSANPASASTSSPSAAPAAAAAATGVRLSFRDESWVEITQADGRVIHSQINAAGSEQRVDGKAPLKLVVGNASSVSVDYKGRAIDLKPVTSADNVARITLN